MFHLGPGSSPELFGLVGQRVAFVFSVFCFANVWAYGNAPGDIFCGVWHLLFGTVWKTDVLVANAAHH